MSSGAVEHRPRLAACTTLRLRQELGFPTLALSRSQGFTGKQAVTDCVPRCGTNDDAMEMWAEILGHKRTGENSWGILHSLKCGAHVLHGP